MRSLNGRWSDFATGIAGSATTPDDDRRYKRMMRRRMERYRIIRELGATCSVCKTKVVASSRSWVVSSGREGASLTCRSCWMVGRGVIGPGISLKQLFPVAFVRYPVQVQVRAFRDVDIGEAEKETGIDRRRLYRIIGGRTRTVGEDVVDALSAYLGSYDWIGGPMIRHTVNGSAIKVARQAKSISAENLSSAMGWTRSRQCQLERGTVSSVTEEVACDIVRFLNDSGQGSE